MTDRDMGKPTHYRVEYTGAAVEEASEGRWNRCDSTRKSLGGARRRAAEISAYRRDVRIVAVYHREIEMEEGT